MEDPEELFLDKDQPISELRRKRFSKSASKKYSRSKGYRFLLYDEDFQSKLKDFRDQFGRLRSKHRKSLEELSLKINSLERRLQNARTARDAYLDYLKLKYPLWKPMLSSYAGVPREIDQLNPLESIWKSVMNNNENPLLNNPMMNYHQTQRDVQELATQMRELQLRLAHSSATNRPIHNEYSAAFQNNQLPPNFHAFEQNVKYPQNKGPSELQERGSDHLWNEVSAAPSNREPMNKQPDSIKDVKINTRESNSEEVVQERTVTFPSVMSTEKKIEAPQVQNQPEVKKKSGNSSQIMNLLSKKVETSEDSDDDDIAKAAVPNLENRKLNDSAALKKPTDTKGSLSMYLKKIADADSSSSEDIFAPVKKLGRMDSDSDFFG